MSSKDKLKLRKGKYILRYHTPHEATEPEGHAHHMLFMFIHFRKKSSLNNSPSGA